MGLLDMFGEGGEGSTAAALRELQGVSLPELKEFFPEEYKKIVELNPELESATTLGPSAMEGISTDPRLKQAQLAALSKLQNIGDAGGRDAQFMADNARITNDVNANLKGNTDAIAQNLATRGLSGGLSELVQKNMAAQNSANLHSQQEMDINAAAQKRALDAILQSGQLGGQIQNQDFAQKAQVAGATDAISKFNAANTQDVRSRNVASKNAAQEYNANNAQNTANTNTATRNDAKKSNLDLAQQNFNNQMTRAGAVAGGYQNQAAAQNAERAGNMQLIGNLAGAAATGGASIYASAAANAAKKKQGAV